MRRAIAIVFARLRRGPLLDDGHRARSAPAPIAPAAAAAFRPQSRPGSVDWPERIGRSGRHALLAADSRSTATPSARLEVAWTYHTGDAQPEALTTIECTPIVVDGVMFVTSPRGKVIALDAARGTPSGRSIRSTRPTRRPPGAAARARGGRRQPRRRLLGIAGDRGLRRRANGACSSAPPTAG